ncbi:MAG: CDP-alcohol phosphatidyltransferase family protein [Nitrospinota bacterium]
MQAVSGYQPRYRRPTLGALRRTTQGAVRICLRLEIHPDAISYLSIVAAAAAALCFWRAKAYPVLLIAGPLFCYLRGWLNILDGMVAVAAGKASRRGEFVQDLADRISDVLIFLGVAYSGLNSMLGGYLAAIFALLTAYVGVLGQAVGVQREFSGLMSKPWRMVVLNVGAWLTHGLLRWGVAEVRYAGWTVLDWALLVIMLGCVQTIGVRLVRILRALRVKATGPTED